MSSEKSKRKMRAAVMLGVMAALSRQSSNPVKEEVDVVISPEVL